jgi:hypothetical protein
LIRQKKVNNLSTVNVSVEDAQVLASPKPAHKNRFFRRFFSPSIQLRRRPSQIQATSYNNLIPRLITSQIPTPLRFTHQKDTRNILRKFGACAVTRPRLPFKKPQEAVPVKLKERPCPSPSSTAAPKLAWMRPPLPSKSIWPTDCRR